MGTVFVVAFLAVFTLAIGQALLRRRLNPYGEVAYAGLPEELRSEIERVLPGFQHRLARITKRGDEARIEGDYLGEAMRVEAEFDGSGGLREFEVDGPRGARARGVVAPEDVPEPAVREIDRVLGDALSQFERSVVTGGTSGGEDHFEIKGRAGDWKWEIAVSASGRLLEVEKERRRQR